MVHAGVLTVRTERAPAMARQHGRRCLGAVVAKSGGPDEPGTIRVNDGLKQKRAYPTEPPSEEALPHLLCATSPPWHTLGYMRSRDWTWWCDHDRHDARLPAHRCVICPIHGAFGG
jgi:hypothetical protein